MDELNGGPPIGVLVWRGERVESEHRVAYVVADPDGRLLQSAGDVDRPVFPRSAVKPLQAIALVESGAAERFALTERELALACASHSGEPEHVRLVNAWLARLGLDGSALECGAHPPLHGPSAESLVTTGRSPERIHNNCSGKHAGMLTLARHLEVPVAGYSRADHPVQRRVADVLRAMTGLAELAPPAIDGCGIPAFAIALGPLAVAMARFAHPAGLPAARAQACARLQAAMRAHPYLVAGTDRACTEIMTAAPQVLVKTGAEGVYAACLPRRRLGLVLKVADGAGRAAPVALLALLRALDALDAQASTALAHRMRPELRNHAGVVVGHIEPVPGWPAWRQLS
ncbi:MAG TPA: asparaginase [Geminicoccaceae bacterium]